MLPWAGVSHSQEEKLPQKGVRITVWATHDKFATAVLMKDNFEYIKAKVAI